MGRARRFPVGGIRDVEMPFTVDGAPVMARLRYGDTGLHSGSARTVPEPVSGATIIEDAGSFYVISRGRQTVVSPVDFAAAGETAGGGTLRAPMHGKVLAMLAIKGQAVRKGERVAILESHEDGTRA